MASQNAAGSASEEYAKYLDSIEGKTAQLKATWQSFSTNFLDSSFIKGVVDALRSLLSVLDAITNKLGGGATTGLIGGLAIGGFATASKIKASGGILQFAKTIIEKVPKATAVMAESASAATTTAATFEEAFLFMAEGGEAAAVGATTAATATSGLASSLLSLAAPLGIIAGVLAVGLVGVAAVDNYYNGWNATLKDTSNAAKESSKSLTELSEAQKKVNDAKLVLNDTNSSQEQIDEAKETLQSISDMLKEKYDLTIDADVDKLNNVLDTLTSIERSEALKSADEFIESFSQGSNGQKSGLAVYQESASILADNIDKQTQLYELQSRYQSVQQQLANEKSNITSTGDFADYGKINELYTEFKKINQEAEALGYNVGTNVYSKIKGAVDSADELDLLFRAAGINLDVINKNLDEADAKLEEARAKMAEIKAAFDVASSALTNTLFTDVKNGESTGTILADTQRIIDLGKAAKEAGIATKDLAMQYAYAREGYASFEEAYNNGKAESMASNIIAIQKNFGESAAEAVQTAALAMIGLSDSTQVTSDNVKALYENMKKLGEENGVVNAAKNALEGTAMLSAGFESLTEVTLAGEKGVSSFLTEYLNLAQQVGDADFTGKSIDEQSAKLTSLAKSLDLIEEDKYIKIDANGAISVCDTVLDKLRDIYNYGERSFTLNVDSNLKDGEHTFSEINDIANELDGKEVTVKVDGDGNAEIKLDNVKQKVKSFDQESGKAVIDYEGCDVEVDTLHNKIVDITKQPYEIKFNADGLFAQDFGDVYNTLSNLKSQFGDLRFSISADKDGLDVLNEAGDIIAKLQDNDSFSFSISADDSNLVEIVNKATNEKIRVPIDYFVGSQEKPITDWWGLETVDAEISTEPQQSWDGSESVSASVTSPPQTVWSGVMNVVARVTSWLGTAGADPIYQYAGTASTRGLSYSNGTAISGMSYARGNWGIPYDQTALVGEAGAEIRVNSKTGKWELLGANSAQFAHLNKGDIIFNAQQTRDLIKHGKIIKGSRRGRTYGDSYASGTALLGGNAYVSATAPDGTTRMDYIERLFEKMEKSIDRIRTKAESAYKSLETRTKASYGLIDELKSAANTYKQGADTYLNYANSIEGHPVAIAQGKDGQMAIWDAGTEHANQTKAVEEWMSKYEDSLQKYLDTLEDIAEAYKDLFDMIEEHYEHELKMVEALSDSYDNLLDKIETSGYLVDSKVYANLITAKTNEIAVLNKELAELEKSFKEAMDSGYIEEGSDAWYEMKESINDTKNAIEECEVDLIKLRKEMRDAEWDYFDYLEGRINSLKDESDFMIDLMENYDLYKDNGELSEYGMATMGLHGQNYNTLMNQADAYAKEIKALNAQIAKDPNNTELIDRRQELIELQQKSILAAEDEKQAIKDLVKEGIEKELDSLQDLIDKYNETQDSARDLYDYQKNITKQAEEVANLQKQLSSYQGDMSIEARAKVQEITLKLEDAQEELYETQYEKYMSDQKKLLDNLYTEYELLLNERADNTDALINDAIDSINANSAYIGNTLFEVSDNVGYTMTDSMQKVWDGSTLAIDGVITKYGDNFDTKLTAVNETLSAIRTSVDKVAGVNQESVAQSKSSSSSSSSSATKSTTTTTSTTTSAPVAKSIAVGGLINAGSAPIYEWAGGQGYSQYFSDDPIYTVLDESNGFVQVRWHNLSSGITGWFRKSDVTAYKKGGLVDFTGLAWLDGTPENPEYILNSEDTKALMGVGSAPKYSIGNGSISDLLNNLSLSTGNIGITVGDIVTNIDIDHVQDYSDLVSKMQQDNQFEKMIQSMTIDRLAGKSSLIKNKYKW